MKTIDPTWRLDDSLKRESKYIHQKERLCEAYLDQSLCAVKSWERAITEAGFSNIKTEIVKIQEQLLLVFSPTWLPLLILLLQYTGWPVSDMRSDYYFRHKLPGFGGRFCFHETTYKRRSVADLDLCYGPPPKEINRESEVCSRYVIESLMTSFDVLCGRKWKTRHSDERSRF